MLTELCRQYTQLADSDIESLERIADSLPHICKLTNADIFIDCFYHNNSKCLVVAEARPAGGGSVYQESVVGKFVLPDKEPAVFNAMQTGAPVRDILGVTQENKTVWQVVIPIKNPEDNVIGVLIQERDISARVSRDKKYDELVQITEKQREKLHRLRDAETAFMPGLDDNSLVMKEIHHRVKNNLQLIASMLNLQARKTDIPEIKNAFRENVNRTLSIASIYDVLSLDGGASESRGKNVPLLRILRQVCGNVISSAADGECRLAIAVEGEDIAVDHEKATSIALAVNELVMNAAEHAFTGRTDGRVSVTVKPGNRYVSISVADDGRGFSPDAVGSGSLGMNIVRSLVREKLGGVLHVESGGNGSRFSMDFEL